MSGPPPELVAELTRLRAKYGDVVFQAAVTALPEKTGLLLLAERTKRRGPGRPKKKAHESAMLQMAQIIATGASVRAASRVAANGDESLAESYRKEFPKDREKWLAAVQRPRGTLTTEVEWGKVGDERSCCQVGSFYRLGRFGQPIA